MALRPGQGEPTLSASETADGVFCVRAPRGGPPRRGPAGAGRMVGTAAAAAGLIVLIVAAFALMGGEGAHARTPWGPVVQDVASPAPDRAVLEARYQDALALGRAGRYLEARGRMLTLVPFGRSEAAVRAFSVRAAQALLAEARATYATRPERARALVDRAAAIAPWLSSLDEARALVGA